MGYGIIRRNRKINAPLAQALLNKEGNTQSSTLEKGDFKVESRVTITQVAAQLGVSVKTILRWEKAGKIRKARRDWRGWRVYAAEEINQLKDFFQTVY